MTRIYISIATACIAITLALYSGNFYIHLNRGLSTNPEQWGQFGDYIGGLLNPTFSFLSFILLIKSLSLQNNTNRDLRLQIKTSEEQDKLKSLEHQLTLLIDSQTRTFNDLEIKKDDTLHKRAKAVELLEKDIEDIINKYENTTRKDGTTAIPENITVEIFEHLETMDDNDSIYNLIRVFANMIRVVSQKLSDQNGFTKEHRNEYYNNLINITDFANLRLILLALSYCPYEQCKEILKNKELATLMEDLGMPLDLYSKQ